MPRLYVVYDSNVYRTLGAPAFDAILALEANHSVVAVASYFVISEFLAHIADATDPSYAMSWGALRRLWRHCKQYDGSRELLRLIGDSEAQVPRTLFGELPRGRDDQAHAYGNLVGRLIAQGGPTWPEAQRELTRNRQHVLATEDMFVQQLFNHVVKGLEPAATSWADVRKAQVRPHILQKIKNGDGQRLVAQAIIAKAANEIGRSLSVTELQRLGQQVQEIFPVSVAFYDTLVHRIVRDGLDMSKYPRPNSLWDYQITFSIGKGARLLTRPIWLITNDSDMLAAAKHTGETNVRNFEAYRDLLLLSPELFDAQL